MSAVVERVSDVDFLLDVLSRAPLDECGERRWTSGREILAASFRERGCGLTIHSRASDLRHHRGVDVEQRRLGTKRGRPEHGYRLGRGEAS